MADSHGRPEYIKAAFSFLKEEACEEIYHLGDICDSSRSETAEECVNQIRENGIIAVRGNNDHRIVIDNQDESFSKISYDIVDYLQNLPVVLESKEIVCTHSLPFYDEFGVSCMIGPMRDMDVRSIFAKFPNHILFRGHSHAPWIVWRKRWKVTSKSISSGETICLEDRFPCVVTCGALTRGLCMVWNAEEKELVCLSFE